MIILFDRSVVRDRRAKKSPDGHAGSTRTCLKSILASNRFDMALCSDIVM